VLAVVEGDRLARFEIEAPFAGVVIDRHVTVGEPVAPSRTAFILADLSTVWIDVTVYQHVAVAVTTGQPVWISAGPRGPSAQAAISWVSPVLDRGTRAAVARVELANPDGAWRPGMFATAVVSKPTRATIVVPHGAVHRLGGRTVIFVAEDDHFVARTVRLGTTGRSRVAVATGLAPGERYAATRSFLVKAELAKGEAAHDH
jgi:cobalt-zinc-cadmium efflux system membrane fusion protein